VVPPLAYYYQDDPNVRGMADQKLLGRDLLIAASTDPDERTRYVYLPAGEWIDRRTGERYDSPGRWYGPFPLYVEGRFRLPTFARAGAIVPRMYVDEKTMNALGRRSDGSVRDELIVSVYADDAPSAFTLYEDDGETVAYREGAVRTTLISQLQGRKQVTVTISTPPSARSRSTAGRWCGMGRETRSTRPTRGGTAPPTGGSSPARAR